MTNSIEPGHYLPYNLEPSQCAEWIIREAADMQSHVLVAFGWMSQRPAEVNLYHKAAAAEQIERIRQIAAILEAHINAFPDAPVAMANIDQSAEVF